MHVQTLSLAFPVYPRNVVDLPFIIETLFLVVVVLVVVHSCYYRNVVVVVVGVALKPFRSPLNTCHHP